MLSNLDAMAVRCNCCVEVIRELSRVPICGVDKMAVTGGQWSWISHWCFSIQFLGFRVIGIVQLLRAGRKDALHRHWRVVASASIAPKAILGAGLVEIPGVVIML